uniref:Uncharacterized protein n=1 Tax=Nymphaea colorata TaxID=210225 RepID=A0A5K1EK61_9MAGN
MMTMMCIDDDEEDVVLI